MKGPLKPNRVCSCICFIVIAVTALSFLGCAPKEKIVIKEVEVRVEVPAKPIKLVMIPLNDDIIAEVGGIAKTQDFQYYISKTIFLSLDAGQSNSMINKEGQMIRIGSNVRDSITIEAYKPGIILLPDQTGTVASNLNRLDISFEKQEGYPVIPFGKRGYGSTEKYEILYTNDANRTVDYAGLTYTVSFNDPYEPPYLMITIEETATGSSSNRGVSGLTLDQR